MDRLPDQQMRPNFEQYHRSIADELRSVKNRIRNLVQDRHWQTDGEHKEAALRAVLRRPQSIWLF